MLALLRRWPLAATVVLGILISGLTDFGVWHLVMYLLPSSGIRHGCTSLGIAPNVVAWASVVYLQVPLYLMAAIGGGLLGYVHADKWLRAAVLFGLTMVVAEMLWPTVIGIPTRRWPNPLWIFSITTVLDTIAVPCAVAGAWVIARSRLKYSDRLHSGHCRQCGYDLTGNRSGVCPECGAGVPKPAQESALRSGV